MSDLKHKTQILLTQRVTHDVKRFICSRPPDFTFEAGEAVELAIVKDGWEDETRPFTFTSMPTDEVLEFTIKKYVDHHGVTEQIHTLKAGHQLQFSDSFGAIKYKGEGVFIAGGAGITPFLSILRTQDQKNNNQKNSLIFANKSPEDTVLEKELELLTGGRFIRVYSDKSPENQSCERIDKEFLASHIDNFDQSFYVCGPPGFTDDITEYLEDLGANPDSITLEE